jgi:hypothetical protein
LKHLRVVIIPIVLLLGITGAAIFTANAGAPVGGNTLTPRAYLPLVARSESWITVLEEGFEAAPGPLWQFHDNSVTDPKEYKWGRRDCLPYTGKYSAWAVGGGADGIKLTCGSAYPDDVDSWMKYGPFDLTDAKMAQIRFRYYQNGLEAGDSFLWYASDDNVQFYGLYLNANPGDWTPLVFDLGNVLGDQPPSLNFLGKPQVWVMFHFTSDATGHPSPGPFVDDVLIRKCLDTLCSPFSAAAPAPGQTRAIRMLPTGH